MKKWVVAALLVVGVIVMAGVGPSEAGGRARVFVGVGVGPGWWGPYYPYSPWWYYPPYPPYYTPPPVVVQSPPVYIQQPPVAPAPPAPPAPAAPGEPSIGYWYYCPSAQAYYPNVQTCPDAWVKVPPRTE